MICYNLFNIILPLDSNKERLYYYRIFEQFVSEPLHTLELHIRKPFVNYLKKKITSIIFNKKDFNYNMILVSNLTTV